MWAIPKREDVRNKRIHSLQWIPCNPLLVMVRSPTLSFADSGERNDAITSEGILGFGDPWLIERVFQRVKMKTNRPSVVILNAISSLIGEYVRAA
jgi:hypothetical protein